MRFNQLPIRFGFAGLMLAGILTACPSPTAPSVASIAIAGAPTDDNLKINAPITLTATAKDSSGAAINGTVFTWVSSNPDAVSVDASGVVTGRKFGKATITASAGGVSAATLEQTTYGLEASFGTYVYGTATSVRDTGTFALYRFRLKTGISVPAATKFDFTTKGPTGWNNGKVDVETSTVGSTAKAIVTGYFGNSLISVAGGYSASVIYAGETFSSQTTIVNPAITMMPPTITISSATTSAVTANWTAVPTALGYYSEVLNGTDNSFVARSPDGPNLSATMTGLTLDTAKSPVMFVYSFNFDVANLETTAFPANASSSGTGKFITISTL